MVLDFKEIPEANGGGGYQDTFELFTRDFLEDLGYEIIQHPDRGADGKKDLIVGETRSGVGGKTIIRWLVSCKHFAFSGKSVSDTDEPDIIDRMAAHKCDGFIGVYSTIPAVSLSGKLTGYNDRIEQQIFDRERIEKYMLDHQSGITLAKRYFPVSFAKYWSENPTPAEIFSDEPALHCECCGKNLIQSGPGIFVALKHNTDDFIDAKYINVYFACKGECDDKLKRMYRSQGIFDAGWEDIEDLKTPSLYLRNMMGFINLVKEDRYEDKAFGKMKELYINVFPNISRHLTESEKERVSNLYMFGF